MKRALLQLICINVYQSMTLVRRHFIDSRIKSDIGAKVSLMVYFFGFNLFQIHFKSFDLYPWEIEKDRKKFSFYVCVCVGVGVSVSVRSVKMQHALFIQ